jgi:hypothetical protein
MQRIFIVVPALLLAGAAAAQGDGRGSALDPQVKVPPVEFRSAFDGYRPFAEQEMRDWRGANEEVGAASVHAGHRPGQGPGQQTSKPQPGKPAGKGHGAHK